MMKRRRPDQLRRGMTAKAFSLKLLKLGKREELLLKVFLAIALVLHVLGLYSAVSDIVKKWQGGTPFMCDIP